ncbi:MAG: Gfo/Idh/MocA family oxidoreductase, partial [Chthoniobacterales bacterium]
RQGQVERVFRFAPQRLRGSKMKLPISLAVVGCGYWGPNLIRNFRNLPDCSLKAMCDRKEERLTHLTPLYPEVAPLTEFEKVLAIPDLTAVAIATPVKHHFNLAKASLLAGKHTFIEKPMASSSEECLELIDLAERKGLVLMIGHTFLYSAPVKRIAEIIDSGDLGEIRYINSRRLNLGLFQHDINVAWDLAPHDISIILHLLGEFPLSVNCTGHSNVTPHIEDITNMSLSFSRKRFATIQSSWLEPRKVREMTIVGSKRMIIYDDLQTHEKIRVYDVRVERPPHYDTFAEFHYSYHYGDSYIPHLKQEEPLKTECQHFLDCIANGTSPATGGEAGLKMVRILEAASNSLAANGAPVSFSAIGEGEDQIPSIVSLSAQSAA